ncbi:insulinase family protein [Methanococcoides sp. SA1]|nr:insulinase family protein [Methanococcoides sp. SA1]
MKFQKKVLDNGLTVLFEKRDVDVTIVMLGVRYGSGYDSVEEKGMAHFIEHLCFKGTEKRNTKEIAEELEGVGGEMNAFTSDDVTAYHVKLPSKHLGLAMDVIFDIFFNPIFPEEDVERERQVVFEEIKMYNDNPRAHVLNKIKENLYEEPFGYCGLGRAEVVRGMTREQLKGKHDEVYVPENSVLTVVGNNDFEEIVALAEKLTPSIEKKEEVGKPTIIIRNVESEEKKGDLHQANVALGFHFPKSGDRDRYAAEIFSAVLGEGMSSRLFTEVREKRGLVYGVKSDLDSGKDHGYMIIWAGTDPAKVGEVKEICLEEFHKMKDLTQSELEKAKVQVKGNWKVDGEGCGETALNLLIEEVEGDAEEYYKYEERIDEVGLSDVRKLAEKVDFAWFSLGP